MGTLFPVHETDPEADVAGESLAEAFRSVARLIRQASAESLARWDVTPSQFRALRILLRDGAMRPSELSEHLRIAPRSATEVLDSLETKGLIERGPDPHDRRATLVALTEPGVRLGASINAARGNDTERVFDRLSPADREHLARILRRLLE